MPWVHSACSTQLRLTSNPHTPSTTAEPLGECRAQLVGLMEDEPCGGIGMGRDEQSAVSAAVCTEEHVTLQFMPNGAPNEFHRSLHLSQKLHSNSMDV